MFNELKASEIATQDNSNNFEQFSAQIYNYLDDLSPAALIYRTENKILSKSPANQEYYYKFLDLDPNTG